MCLSVACNCCVRIFNHVYMMWFTHLDSGLFITGLYRIVYGLYLVTLQLAETLLIFPNPLIVELNFCSISSLPKWYQSKETPDFTLRFVLFPLDSIFSFIDQAWISFFRSNHLHRALISSGRVSISLDRAWILQLSAWLSDLSSIFFFSFRDWISSIVLIWLCEAIRSSSFSLS